ncbi:MAG: hypothetical protein AAB268_05910 [Elusimicrobiota bacterium]
MKIKKKIAWDIISMSEQMSNGYEKPGSPIQGEDLERFTSAFKGMGAALRLKKRIRAVDAVGFCDALQKVVVLE